MRFSSGPKGSLLCRLNYRNSFADTDTPLRTKPPLPSLRELSAGPISRKLQTGPRPDTLSQATGGALTFVLVPTDLGNRLG